MMVSGTFQRNSGGFFGIFWGKECKEGELICLSAGYYHLHISLQKFSYHLGTCDPPVSCCKPLESVDSLIPGAKQGLKLKDGNV